MSDLLDNGSSRTFTSLPKIVFLYDRHFKVEAGFALSDLSDQKMDVLHGSLFSVVFFIIKTNRLAKCIGPGSEESLFIDDIRLCYRSKNMNTI